jgi:hypothetical protein
MVSKMAKRREKLISIEAGTDGKLFGDNAHLSASPFFAQRRQTGLQPPVVSPYT